MEEELEKIHKMLEDQQIEIEIKDKDISDLKDDLISCEHFISSKEDEVEKINFERNCFFSCEFQILALNAQLLKMKTSSETARRKIQDSVETERLKSSDLRRKFDEKILLIETLEKVIKKLKIKIVSEM